jgi:hypothetical protein
MAENCLVEITSTEFWKLEDRINEIEGVTGKLQISNHGGKLYHNSGGNWLREYKGIYFCHPTLKKFLK